MPRRSYIELDLPLLIDSAFAAGAAMITFGAVLGKTSPAQITWLLLLQVPLYAANAHLATAVREYLRAPRGASARMGYSGLDDGQAASSRCQHCK